MTSSTASIPDSCPPGWAHEVGALALGKVATVPETIAEVADRLMVQETASRYALAYDERRIDILEDVFTEDVLFAYSISGGGYEEFVGRDSVVAWLRGIMDEQFDQRRHVCGNLIVDRLDGNEAVLTMYLALFASAEQTELVTTGFYRLSMRKVANAWRIHHVYDGLDRPF